jgi:signal transduction histidine kinase
MSSVQTERLLGSTSFRLSAAYAVLLVIAFLVAGAAVWLTTRTAAEQEVRERIQLEMSALQQEIRAEGLPAAIAAIRTRLENPGALEYRLIDRSGALLVGNLTVGAPTLGWATVRISDAREQGEASEDFLALTERIPDGAILTIGDDLDNAEGVRESVLNALMWVAIPTLILVIGVGVLLALGTARRMRSLSLAMGQVGLGDLTARAPETGGDEIARMGQGVNEMVARIDGLVVSIRRVSTDIAHDLRTPLAHVRQDLESAATSADPTTREGIRAAQGRIDDILRVFHAILRLAEIDAGGVRARFSEVDLATVVERVADAYRAEIEENGRVLVLGPLQPTEVRGDVDLIAQALANLIENAMRHTPSGSSIRVNLRKSSGSVCLFVEDEGPGIPEADRVRVLEPFVRLDGSRSTPGAGLGLSIVNSIARLHGARLSLEDAQPGLRVAIDWPV